MNIDSRGGLGYTETRWYIFEPPDGTLLLRRLYTYLLNLPENVCVFKIREEGNFDFGKERKWIGSKRTTKIID